MPSLGGQQPTAHRSWFLLSALQEEPGLLGEMAAFRTRGREGQNDPGVCFLPKSEEVLRERGGVSRAPRSQPAGTSKHFSMKMSNESYRV